MCRRGRRPRCLGGATNWVGFAPETTYRIEGGVLRKRVPLDRRRQAAAAMYRDEEAAKSDELEEAFYANADQMSVDDAERFARTVARYRAKGSVNVTVAQDIEQRTVLGRVGDSRSAPSGHRPVVGGYAHSGPAVGALSDRGVQRHW